MRPVLWAGPAERDLAAIDEYWLQASEQRADAVLARIRAAGEFLGSMPKAGPAIETGPFRKWRVGGTDYLLIYRVLNDAIQILRVRHGRGDWL